MHAPPDRPFSPIGLLLRPARTAPGLHGGATDFATLFLGLALGAALAVGATRHAALGPHLGPWDVFFIAVLLAPVAGYGLLRAAARVAVFTLGRDAPADASGTLAALIALCLMPLLGATLLAAIAIVASGMAWFDGPSVPFWGGGVGGTALGALAAAAAAWSLWAGIVASAARFGLSKAAATLLVSSTIAFLSIAYALLIAVLSAMIG